MSEWMLHALNFALPLAGIGLCLYLFCTVKQELHQLSRRGAEKHSVLQQRMEDAIRGVEAAVCEARQPAGPGIGRSNRAEALRMHRRGESAASIAGALRLPRNEVELLLKVYRLQMEAGISSPFAGTSAVS